MSNSILFITTAYPYGKKETFIENEIESISQHFEKVYILPCNLENESKKYQDRLSNLPNNVEVLTIQGTNKRLSSITDFLKVFFTELSHLKTAFKLLHPKNLRLFLGSLKQALGFKLPIESILKKNQIKNCLVYSYWGEFWLTPILLLKQKFNLKVITRLHRFDLYNEIHEHNYFPLKPFFLKYCDGVYPISEQGKEYIEQHYSNYENLGFFRLGIPFHNHENPNEKTGNFIRIVSCANMYPVKQIDKLIDVLKMLDINIRWEHFGDGPLRSELEKMAATFPENIKHKFHGLVPNSEVHQYYRNNRVDLFINTSSSEGIPVSIMEALSYGIPVIATDVGGTREVVEMPYGQLLHEHFTPLDLKNEIMAFCEKDQNEMNELRSFAKSSLFERFNAERNYDSFMKHIKNV